MFVLVTSNDKKIGEFKTLLRGLEFEVMKLEYPELRSDEPCEVVKTAAKALCERAGKPVVVEDSGLFIEALGNFPGTCTKYAYERIGNNGILKIMKGIKNRRCFYKSAVAYCEVGKEPVCFLGVEEGKIAEKKKGKNGWGQDPIFVPKGKSKTYGQIRNKGDVNLFRKEAIEKLKDFLRRGKGHAKRD